MLDHNCGLYFVAMLTAGTAGACAFDGALFLKFVVAQVYGMHDAYLAGLRSTESKVR